MSSKKTGNTYDNTNYRNEEGRKEEELGQEAEPIFVND
jgi:hypothetical protein